MKKLCPFVLTVSIFVLFVQCKEDKPLCVCSIPLMAEEEVIKGTEKTGTERAATIDPKIEAQIRSEIKAEVSAGLKYSNIYEQVNETYKKVRNTNPEVNNTYNWYRAIACAYYEVICQDETFTGAERRNELNKVIANFEVNFRNALQGQPQEAGQMGTERPVPSNGGLSKKKGEFVSSPSPTATATEPPMFNPNAQTEVAILTTGNDPGRNTGFVVGEVFHAHQLSTTNSFFYPNFKNMYFNAIQQGDLSFFEKYDLRGQTKCICLIETTVNVKDAEYLGENYKKAEGTYHLNIIQVGTLQSTPFTINEKGVGITETAAFSDLDEKFKKQFANKFKNYSSCKK